MDIQLDHEDKLFLTKVVRDTLFSRLTNNVLPVYYKSKNVYREKAGLFIKLSIKDEVRAYGGIVEPEKSLIETVQDCTVNISFHDRRFAPVSSTEMEKLNIQMAVITGLEGVAEIKTVQLKEEGLLVEQNWKQAVLLPWDLASFDLSAETAIRETAMKAGISDFDHLRIRRLKLVTFGDNA
ncbi:MAG: AMMECR1 domain-containing protein [bacterium]|nr:AMMECR1 domain-containing protein [bacterium]